MEKTALVKCIRKYDDIQLGRRIYPLEELTVSLDRAKELIDGEHKVCELIEIK